MFPSGATEAPMEEPVKGDGYKKKVVAAAKAKIARAKAKAKAKIAKAAAKAKVIVRSADPSPPAMAAPDNFVEVDPHDLYGR